MEISERIKADIQAILRKALSPVMNEFKKYFNTTEDHIDADGLQESIVTHIKTAT